MGARAEASFTDLASGSYNAGRYQDPQPTACGGTATVLKCRDTTLGRAVAVKVFDRVDPDRGAQLQRRAVLVTARAQPHPCVHRPLDAGTTRDGHAYLVFDWFDRGTLRDQLLDHGVLPASHVAHMGIRLAEALDTLHQAGFVHGDVTPANVLLGPDGEPVVIDVAGAVRVEREPLRGGTPGFVAPEVDAATGAVGTPVDVFSLCRTLIAAYVGIGNELPASETIDRGADERVAIAAGAGRAKTYIIEHDDRLLQVLTSGTSIAPGERPTLRELTSALQDYQRSRLVDPTPSTLTPPGPSRPSVSPAPRSRPVNWSALCLVMLVHSVVVTALILVGLRATSLVDDHVGSDDTAGWVGSTGEGELARTPVDPEFTGPSTDCDLARSAMDGLFALAARIAYLPSALGAESDDLRRFEIMMAQAAARSPSERATYLTASLHVHDYFTTGADRPNPAEHPFATAMRRLESVAADCDPGLEVSWTDVMNLIENT